MLGDQECCIDEFDKMGSSMALLEAMEQQSIAKRAWLVHFLPARLFLRPRIPSAVITTALDC